MEALLAFFATLVSLRLSADLVRRYRQRPAPGLLAWAAALGAFAAGSGAIAWGSAADWSNPAFRVYYLFGGLLAAALLGAGSLQWAGVRWVGPLTLVYVGLAIGVAVAVPLTTPVGGSSIPRRRRIWPSFPPASSRSRRTRSARSPQSSVAVIGIRRRPLGNSLILAGLVVAALGSALAGLGKAESSLFSAAAALLLYGGFVLPSRASKPRTDAHPGSTGAAP